MTENCESILDCVWENYRNLKSDHDELRDEIRNILDLLRTCTPPMVYNMSIDEWNIYKIEKCSGKLQRILDKDGKA